MKKLLEKTDLLAGIFAVVAFVAIVCEIAFGGFTKESIAGGIKDMSGILVDVLVLVIAASVLIRKPVNFKEKFNTAMDSIKDKYNPLLVEDKKEGVIRYNIASNSDALFSQTGKSYKRIFELAEDKPEEIRFYINKSFFDQKGGSEFNASLIANEIAMKLANVYKEYTITPKQNKENYELHIVFNHSIESNEDIDSLVSLIDYTILLFVARNKSWLSTYIEVKIKSVVQ